MTTLLLSDGWADIDAALHACGQGVTVCLTERHAKLSGDRNPRASVSVSSWRAFDELAALAKKMAGRIDFVACRDESASIAAAFLRERLKLAGMTVDEARGFVDRAAMMSRLKAANLPVAQQQTAADAPGIRRASVSVKGFPVVVKPRMCTGASYVNVVADEKALAALEFAGMFARPARASRCRVVSQDHLPPEEPDGVIVEEYLHVADEYHADALWVDGKPVYHVAGRYHTPLLRGMGGMLGSVLLNPLAEDASFVLALADSAARALDVRTGFTHTKVFRTVDDRWLIGKIAARPGGAGIQAALWHAYRIDVPTVGARLACGQRTEVSLQPMPRVVGWAGPAIPPGLVLEVAAREQLVGFPGVIDATVTARVGQWGGGTRSGLWRGLAGYVILHGETPDQVLARMPEATARFAIRVMRPSRVAR